MKCSIPLTLLASFVLAPLTAHADELPARKPGLWESKLNMLSNIAGAPGMPETTVKQCIDAKTDQLEVAGLQDAVSCTKREIKKTAAGYEIDKICTVFGMKAESKVVVTGDFVTRVDLEGTTTMFDAPGQPQPVVTKMRMASTRLGDCGPGQSPGDMILPDGTVEKIPGLK